MTRIIKIMHICLASSYTESMTYQDNILPDINASDGHNVLVVSNCSRFEGGNLVPTPETDTVLESGVRLLRIPYDRVINAYVSEKARKASRLLPLLNSFSPDVILFHGMAAWELLTVAKYKKTHPHVRFYADSHEDANNSGRNWLSRHILHGLFYGAINRKVYPLIDKLFYISYETRDYLKAVYRLSEDKMEFFPLGGLIPGESERLATRARIRAELGLSESDVLILHTGKMDPLKRTGEILAALSNITENNVRLVLIGSMPDNVKDALETAIAKDSRVSFLGWKNAEELMAYLCACDIYAQPGSQSATMQNAMCCGAAVMLYPYPSHEPYVKSNGWFVKTVDDMTAVFREAAGNPGLLHQMGGQSLKIARELLDYRKQAAKLYR